MSGKKKCDSCIFKTDRANKRELKTAVLNPERSPAERNIKITVKLSASAVITLRP